jgi:hypothetical protein
MNLAGELSSAGIEPGYIQAANNFFGKNLAAAVALGNPSFVEPDLEWIGKLLSGWHVSTGYLADYLLLYSQVVQDVLGEKGRIITHWLDSYISTH